MKITDVEIAKEIDLAPRSLRNMKAKYPQRYKFIKLGIYADRLKLDINQLQLFSELKKTL